MKISELVLTHVPHGSDAAFDCLALGYVHSQAQVWYAYVTWGTTSEMCQDMRNIMM